VLLDSWCSEVPDDRIFLVNLDEIGRFATVLPLAVSQYSRFARCLHVRKNERNWLSLVFQLENFKQEKSNFKKFDIVGCDFLVEP
jgi:hypothetical protein